MKNLHLFIGKYQKETDIMLCCYRIEIGFSLNSPNVFARLKITYAVVTICVREFFRSDGIL